MRIVFFGAGSVVFTTRLVNDLVAYQLPNLQLVLHDIDQERLAVARATVAQLTARRGSSIEVESTLDRRRALDGADVVIVMVQVGGLNATRIDLEVPASFGLRQTIGDTTGVGGVFRALRTFPVLSVLAEDVRALCPDALLLNYTNPMAMNVGWLAAIAPDRGAVGLCHSVHMTALGLSELVGIPFERTSFRAAGVNHQSWLYEWEADGESLYPRLRAAIDADPELQRRVRAEIFRRIGYYPTETSEHSAEYLSWFLRSDEQIERFRLVPLQYLETSKRNVAQFEASRDAINRGTEVAVEVSNEGSEYAPQIIHSLLSGQSREIHVNVPNQGWIDNLPHDAVVEVPARIDGRGIHPLAVGSIPPQGAALNRASVAVAELTILAAGTGERDLVRQALLADPNAASTLTPSAIWQLADAMFDAHRTLLPSTLGGDVELVLA